MGAVLIGEAPKARTSRSKVYRWGPLVFWAYGGRVRVINEYTNEASSCSRRDFAARALAFSDAVKLLPRPDERVEHQRLAAKMTDCCRDAFNQGDPHSKRGLEEILARPPARSLFGARHYKNMDGGVNLPQYPDGTPFMPFTGTRRLS